MSGHSHFKTIKAQKEITDAKKGKIFSKVAKLISIAAKGGGDPLTNSKLRIAVEQAKVVNMPKDNVERAIERGTGELAGEKLEEVVFEGFGPAGVAIIIEAITDNKNRTLNEIKQILNQNNGKLAGEGAVQWMFERKGTIIINKGEETMSEDQLELTAIESGAEDIYFHEDILEVYTKPEDLEKVKNSLIEKGIKIESSGINLVPKNTVAVDEKTKQNCQKLFEALDENDAVQEIYYNIKN
ncbi:YebC/PmpR family DNA-binding transcriptional regulator [Patescibacteria group bacterium]|nr:YebC/PmpR family DNA-binding transcriptional regulator [Patescibacteria group bacterium]MBU4274369.1 YebC/PmpR family DNA-binding transcriptional regulator [Patescibacteria group bacterium]MBU4367523.1 YebC/PmpR family DNA-binding transcriptional regulator [Patescibacteria group bacterium]MBU4461564.1 YebC/PmpR family DNA-binding transcriptional regulator [Patescibacteria group bacterium]MCG2699461.1 YebC/PmpR family DNA-binding transcriptional regulator [Candidatus Parcubacteria bacterium]